ncbi:kinase-like domain-containing protein [Xylaria palmicola]|nr:kinase-like domain-containing protein [Xylaria palmicola]
MANARENRANEAIIDFTRSFASGSFMNVYAGLYTEGVRAGQACVAKEFKTGSVYQARYFAAEMGIIRRTQGIIDDWNDAGVTAGRILLNRPEIWEDVGTGEMNLVEPMIRNFVKFNSNSGWVDDGGHPWSQAMQALSHFSYANSSGQLLLCDLQGGPYNGGFILSDPVIMSQRLAYGPTDLGPEGIRLFFQTHRCGQFCKREWQRPRYRAVGPVPRMQGTSMRAYLPPRGARNRRPRLQE